jgi:prepilin-type processing-associated H-X9-DG protein
MTTNDTGMNASRAPDKEATRGHTDNGHAVAAGFSRVDLLAIMAGIALLALLLTPALARTRVTDQAFICRNNLRQLIQGWKMYPEDNSDKLPNCFDWVQGALFYTANNLDSTNINYLANGLLGPYVKDVTVYKCPADRSQVLVGTTRLPRVRSVSMSQSFCGQDEGHLEDPQPHRYRHYIKSADMVLPAPANLWVLIDESPDSINDAAFAVAMLPYGGIWQDLPSNLHDGACSFAFADGHYELKKWTDPRTLGLKVTYSTQGPYKLLLANNPDIMWLQDRTTASK